MADVTIKVDGFLNALDKGSTASFAQGLIINDPINIGSWVAAFDNIQNRGFFTQSILGNQPGWSSLQTFGGGKFFNNGWELNPFAATAALSQSVYRLYNRATGEHLFTTSQTELDLITGSPTSAFVNEGAAYRSPFDGTQALYRFLNTSTGLHFYSANDAEKNALTSKPSSGYKFEGQAFTVYGVSTAPVGATPVYRFYDQAKSQHFYSANASEVAIVQSTQPSWKFEGVAWYA